MNNPNAYHGENKGDGFFEGWYYKITSKNVRTLAIIVGIIKAKNGHSFIQFLDSNTKKSEYFKFSVNDFKAKNDEFEVHLLDNYFSLNKIKLNLENENIKIKGNIEFENMLHWKNENNNPSSMGWYNFLPLKCYTQVCFMQADTKGELYINDEKIDMTLGTTYLEKNWGSSFPKKWVWIECNNFDCEDIVLSCNIGVIDMFGICKLGYTIGFMERENFHIFRGTGKIFIDTNDDLINIKCRNKNESLSISVKKKDFIDCLGPNKGNMNIKVKESLNSLVKIQYENDVRKVNYAGRCIGVEVFGF